MKLVFFTVSEVKGGGVSVIGNFSAYAGDYVALIGNSSVGVHAWKNGVDACEELGCSHPITLMEGTMIPVSAQSNGAYSIGLFPPTKRLGGTNGTIRVGSTPKPRPTRRRTTRTTARRRAAARA